MNVQRPATRLVAAILLGGWLTPTLCCLGGDSPTAGKTASGGVTGSQSALDISMGFRLTNTISAGNDADGSTGWVPLGLMAIAGGVVVLGGGGLLWAARKTLFHPRPIEEDPDAAASGRYESAQSLLKRSQPEEAVAVLEAGLKTNPEDSRAWLLVAEIQAVHLHDVSAARETISRLVHRAGLSIQVLASAHERLADWMLAQGGTSEEACASLKEIVQRFPKSEYAQTARNRIEQLLGHLPTDVEWKATQVNFYRKN